LGATKNGEVKKEFKFFGTSCSNPVHRSHGQHMMLACLPPPPPLARDQVLPLSTKFSNLNLSEEAAGFIFFAIIPDYIIAQGGLVTEEMSANSIFSKFVKFNQIHN
jgi:hypothetical protein